MLSVRSMRVGLVHLWRRFHRGRPRVLAVDVRSRDDLPERLDPRVAYVVGASKPKWLILECPCGRGHEIQVSLQLAHAPHWSLGRDMHRSRLSVFPSIDAVDRDQRCHFWLVDGRVDWCKD